MKIDVPDEHLPLIVRALEHYAAYLHATSRTDPRLLEVAELLKKKGPASEAVEEKRGKRSG